MLNVISLAQLAPEFDTFVSSAYFISYSITYVYRFYGSHRTSYLEPKTKKKQYLNIPYYVQNVAMNHFSQLLNA